jgi:DNA polymerase III subunit delta'
MPTMEPQSSWPVVGHAWALDLLAQAIRSGRPSHAYLFTGPAQVGKTTVARAFAQALVCERGEGPPCGVCRTCQRVAEGRYPDVQLVKAEKNNIQIDQVRNLQADAAIAPLEGKRKVFIIREIERATLPAANALLKTLEEPAPHVVLLLTSNRRDQVLPTILSRCQVIGLRPMPLDQLQAALETRWGVDEERARLLARLSAGRPGWAISAHTDPDLWELRAKHLDDLLGLVEGNAIARLAYAEKLSKGDDVETVLGLWAAWWRDILLVQQRLPEGILNLDRRAQLLQQAELFRAEQVEAEITDLVQTLRRIRANVNLRLALDVLLLRLPKPSVT